MEFLRQIFGDKPMTFDEFSQAINAHNGNEANKDKLIKLANLAGGEYVGKGKYDSEVERLNGLLTGKQTELDTANGLIANLEKSAQGNAEMLQQFETYKSQTVELQQQLQETRINAALKVGLIEAGCADIDYVSYKILSQLKEQGKALELDENEHIKGWNELVTGAKTSLPNQFTGSGGRKVLEGGKLPASDDGPVTVTKEQFAKMGYTERLKLKQDNEQLFKQLTTK